MTDRKKEAQLRKRGMQPGEPGRGIACLGDNCVDYYDETGEAFFGGNPVNVSVYLRRLGLDSSYLGAVGTDPFGKALAMAMAERGVDVSHVQMLKGKNALTHVTVCGDERVLGDYEEGVMARFSLQEEDFSFISEHDLAVTGLWGRCEDALERIRLTGVITAFDCADRPEDPAAEKAIPHTDLLFFSAHEEAADEMLRDKMRRLWERGPAAPAAAAGLPGKTSSHIVVATLGSAGSLAYDGREFTRCGIMPCRVVDTMGAGDSYIAGFLAAFLAGKDVGACMRAGAACSAVTLGYRGAWQQMEKPEQQAGKEKQQAGKPEQQM